MTFVVLHIVEAGVRWLPQIFINTNRKVPILDEVKWKSAVVRNDPASLSADLWFHYCVCNEWM